MRKVLVTGAGGFIGGWLVESFQLAGTPVRAGIRSWNGAVRLARRPTEMVPCNVLSLDELKRAVRGCDAIVHCAAGSDQVIVEGTSNVLTVAREQGVARVVHLSSVAVYGSAPGTVDETRPLRSRDSYGRAKIAAEVICREAMADGLPVTILRPSLVYGPFSESWTVSFAKRLWSGSWGTFGPSGGGKCNLVYVTDVVQAVRRALAADQAIGQVFNINGSEIISWNDYFQRFNSELGLAPLRELDAWRIGMRSRLLSPVRSAARYSLRRFGRTISRLHAKSHLAATFMTATESSLKLTPTRQQLERYRLDAVYVIDRASEKLGYTPRVDVALGLRHSVAWLRHHGVLY